MSALGGSLGVGIGWIDDKFIQNLKGVSFKANLKTSKVNRSVPKYDLGRTVFCVVLIKFIL